MNENIQAQIDRIEALLSAPPNTLKHRGGPRVVRQLKKNLARLQKQQDKYD